MRRSQSSGKSEMNSHERRHLIAAAAAKLLAQQQILDYAWARHKAAEAAGVHGDRNLPDFAQIEASLNDYLELFNPQHGYLRELRQRSLELMRMLAQFQPHLNGALARGIALRNATNTIYLYTDSAKDVLFTLMELSAHYESHDVRLSFQRGREESRPAFRIHFEGTAYLLVVLRADDRRHPPIDAVTGRAERGIDMATLQAELSAE
jgi:hypothetical protein